MCVAPYMSTYVKLQHLRCSPMPPPLPYLGEPLICNCQWSGRELPQSFSSGVGWGGAGWERVGRPVSRILGALGKGIVGGPRAFFGLLLKYSVQAHNFHWPYSLNKAHTFITPHFLSQRTERFWSVITMGIAMHSHSKSLSFELYCLLGQRWALNIVKISSGRQVGKGWEPLP